MSSSRDDRLTSTRPSARWQDAPHLVAMRGRPLSEPVRPPAATWRRTLTVSLQTKILGSYFILGGALLFLIPFVTSRVESHVNEAIILVGATLAIGWLLTISLARVSRLARLKESAREISAGDLSKTVHSEEQRGFHDEID